MLDKIIKKLEEKTITFNNKPITVRGTSLNWLIIVGSFSIVIHFIAPAILLNFGIYFRFIDVVDWIEKIDSILLFREVLTDYPIYSELATSKMAIAEFEKNLIESGISPDKLKP